MKQPRTQWIFELARFFTSLKGDRESELPKKMLQAYLKTFFDRKKEFTTSVRSFGTPQYYYDEPAVVSNIARFYEAFALFLDHFQVFYAVKSNAFPGICRSVCDAGFGLDVSSGCELSTALALPCRHIIFSGPGKSDEELKLALEHRDRVTILADSNEELVRISRTVSQEGEVEKPVRVGIRIRRNGKGGWDKFGIPLHDLSRIMERTHGKNGMDLQGIQFHESWNLDPASQVGMIRNVSDYLERHVSPELLKTIRFLDIGGGFWPEQGEWLNPEHTVAGKAVRGIKPRYPFRATHYYRESKPLAFFAEYISGVIKERGSLFRDLEIWMEPGRWISHQSMHILLKVIDRKDDETVITDGGINLLGWERPLTEFIPVLNLTRPSLKEIPVRIFGPLCTPHDVWGTTLFGEGVFEGDVLLIPDQGAYTYSLRQSFIKPVARVVLFNGEVLMEAVPERYL